MARTLAERFWAKVDKDGPTMRPDLTPCWLWTGYRNRGGYGDMYLEKHPHTPGLTKKIRAHQVSWILHNGPISDEVLIRHDCDNPPCIRPDHLLSGTHTDNMQDAARRGRCVYQAHPEKCPRGERSNLARLTLAQVERIRILSGEGWTQTRIAGEFGVTQAAISLILVGRNWKAFP